MQSAVKRALARRGLLADAATYNLVCEWMGEQGERERERLAAHLGDGAREDLLAGVPELDEHDLTRTLGFGYALTTFLVAPVAGSDVPADVARLGAQMNALVSIVDDLVDGGLEPGNVLSREGLRAALDRSPSARRPSVHHDCPRERVVSWLLENYVAHLERLPFAGTRETIRRDHRGYVSEMYRAERASVTDRDGPAVNGKTSVYPLVVQGLPIWLATPAYDRDRYETHVAWLHAVGALIGLIDDAVDLREDARNSAYNAVNANLSDHTPEAVAGQIATRAEHVLDRWKRLISESDPDVSPDGTARLTDVFATVLASWVGGPADTVSGSRG